MAKEKLIGKITHYFNNVEVGIVKLSDKFKVGDKIHIKGFSTDFEQEIESMQVDRKDIKSAKSGDEVGVKVTQKVKEGDMVYKL